MNTTLRNKRVERAQLRVLFKVPFFAPGVARLPVTFDERVKTACTDGKGIRWNPDWFDKLPDAVLPTVLCHEVCHCMLGHLWRAPASNWDVWNQSADHAVNLMLKEWSQVRVGMGEADPFPFPQPESDYCMDPQYSGMSEEQIYSILNKQQQGGGGAQGQGRPQFGEFSEPDPAAPPQAGQHLQTDWQATLLQSARMAQGQGELPASLKRYVEAAVSPQLPWYELLRSWLREQCSEDWDWQRPALEYGESGFILPGLHSEKVGPVVFATDTSGSIDEAMLAQFQTEKQNCLDTMRPASLLDIYCDATIHLIREYVPGETISREAPGGGGTRFEPVFEHLAGMVPQPKALIYLTDLCGSFPKDDPGYPVLWVSWEESGQAPFGHVVRAKGLT